MDEDAMGKVLDKDKLKVALAGIVLLGMLFPTPGSGALYREFELFDTGYEYYLSYQPEKAVEAFTTFIKEFPGSSAVDAALYWLGKSALQLKSYEDAGKYFAEIKRQFPDSPFVRYAEKEAALFPAKKAEAERKAVTDESPAVVAKVEGAGAAPAEKASGEEKAGEKKDSGAVVASEPGREVEQALRPEQAEEKKGEKKTDTPRIGESVSVTEVPIIAQSPREKEPGDTGKPAEGEKIVAERTVPTMPEGGERQKAAPSGTEEKKDEIKAEAVKETAVAEVRKEEGVVQVPVGREEPVRPGVPGGEKAEVSPEVIMKEHEIAAQAEPAKSREEEKKEEIKAEAASKPGLAETKKKAAVPEVPAVEKTYAVQAGAFKKEKTASRFRTKLRKKGYDSVVKKTSSGGGTRFNVLVGEFRTVQEAQKFAVNLREEMGVFAFPVELERARANMGKPLSGKEPAKSAGGNETSSSGTSKDKMNTDVEKGIDTSRELSKNEITSVRIGGKKYNMSEISEFMSGSSAALGKTGIQAIPWRVGNQVEDFINEQVLYEEARRSGITGDPEKIRELSKKYGLTSSESEHAERYFAVLSLVERKETAVSEERPLESLSVKYGETGNEEKAVLATKLQEHARSGMSFEEISRMYPGLVIFSVMKVSDMEGWLRESVRGLKEGDVSVVWKKGGYMILRPVEIRPSPGGSAADSGAAGGEKTFLKDWIGQLRKVSGIEIVRE